MKDKFIEFLRKYYCRFCNPLYSLTNFVNEIESSENSILIKLNNGLRFINSEEEKEYPFVKYGDPRKLGKLRDYPSFGSIFYMLSEIFIEAIYEQHYRPKPGEIVVDIGANVGVFTVKAANIVGDKGKVISIEPEPQNFDLLVKNIRINNLTNVIPIRRGVWSVKDRLSLNLYRTRLCHSLYKETWRKVEDTGKSIPVEVDTLDNILEEIGIEKADFIKMDCEGSEIEALKGMGRTLRTNVKLAIAAYHVVNRTPSYRIIIPELKKKGFEIQYIRKYGIVYGKRRPR
jgi:FkbM family methyltransferase